MTSNSSWQGLPYYPISVFYKEKFGTKVYKIPVSTAETCPNREGLNNSKVCIFCDEWGSAAFPEFRGDKLLDQIIKAKERLDLRFKSGAYLVYFQAYTTTFARTSLLKEQIDIAISVEGIKGIVIGTRPDCISEALLDYLNELSRKDIFIALELGVQSFQENQLKWLERGHTSKKAIESIKRIKEKTKVDLGIHLMFGLPDESDDDVISAAKIINQLPLDNVKLHNLHVLKNTPLEKLYEHKLFKPIDREEYINRVIVFLEHLNPKIAVHRLAAVASRHNELVAPKWAASKMETYQMSLDEFHRRNTFQGRLFTP